MIRDRIYLAWGLIVLMLSYAVPYSVLRECRTLLLYFFWLGLTLVHFAVSLAYLRRWRTWRS